MSYNVGIICSESLKKEVNLGSFIGTDEVLYFANLLNLHKNKLSLLPLISATR